LFAPGGQKPSGDEGQQARTAVPVTIFLLLIDLLITGSSSSSTSDPTLVRVRARSWSDAVQLLAFFPFVVVGALIISPAAEEPDRLDLPDHGVRRLGWESRACGQVN
jgi:hypothetical protein